VNPNDKTIESEDNDYMETGNDEDFNPKRTSTVDLKLKINLKKEVQEREQCDQCDFSTTHKKNLRRHVQRLHTVGDQPSPAPVAKVSEVKKENNAEESSEEVAAEEPATVTYSCEKCDTTSRNKWDMSRHILRIHKEMKYLCDHCDFKSTQTHRLREHIVKKH
jgi:KRAB domain-containing zinc finger protein